MAFYLIIYLGTVVHIRARTSTVFIKKNVVSEQLFGIERTFGELKTDINAGNNKIHK